jgi:serine/threonine-protein kinase
MADDRKRLGYAPTTPELSDTERTPKVDAGSGPDSTLEMPADAMPPPTGVPAAIGHFRVRKQLGEGGMGVVLECEDVDLGRRVAVKLVRSDVDVPAYRARLLREAQAMARLEHPHVVRVYEVGSERDRLFIAMEFVDGVTLTRWLAERRSWRAIISIFVQVGRGLAAAHEAGLVHRDFKPDNVLVDSTGRARVADFGLARLDGDTPALTRTGALMGTPGYMAPEQQFGSDVDARADQYSYCVALREALGGRPLDDARWKAVPEPVRAAITRGLSYDADERFPSMAALLAVLERAQPRRRARWPVALAVLGLLGMVTGVVAAVSSKRRDPAVDPPRPPVVTRAVAPAPIASAPVDAAIADAPLAVVAPIDAHVVIAHVHRDAAPAVVVVDASSVAAVSAPPGAPGLVIDAPTNKRLPQAKPGDPGHLPVVRTAIADLGYDGFDPDHPGSLDEHAPIDQVKLGLVARRHGNCREADKRWTDAIAQLKHDGDDAVWAARAWLGRALCSLGEGKADDAWNQVPYAWGHGNRPVVQLVMAFAKYDIAVAANDAAGKNETYALLLTAERLPDKAVHAALARWLDGLGIGLHQDAPIH